MPSIQADSTNASDRARRLSFRDVRTFQDLTAAVVVTALWWFGLSLLAGFAANPVVLNRVQIEQADFIVEAVVVDRDAGLVDVVRNWQSPEPHNRMAIAGLREAGAKNGDTYVIPVSRIGDGFAVSRGRLSLPRVEPEQWTPPYIYSASPTVVEQLETLLDELQ